MNCPACKYTTDSPAVLKPGELETGLKGMSCPVCAGAFLEHLTYIEWAKAAGDIGSEATVDVNVRPSTEKAGAKFCPYCQSYLVKYDVAADASFTVDRCGRCGGIWLDGNEWEQLKARSLHKDIHRMFSTDWQCEVRADEHGRALKEIWREQFGADYDELMRIKSWIDAHPKSPEIYAFLHLERNAKASAAKNT